jgi:hypothetical protein
MSSEGLRTRDTEFLSMTNCVEKTYREGVLVGAPDEFPVSIVGRETTRSENHPSWRHREKILRRLLDEEHLPQDHHRVKRVRNRDIGGVFSSVKQIYGDSDGSSTIRPLSLRQPYIAQTLYDYQGPLFARSGNVGPGSSHWPAYSEVALSQEMQQRGTTAIANTIPTNPAVGVGQLIGESMERLPAFPGAAVLGGPGRTSKKLADEYLNVEFGLKPLLNDITGIVQTQREATKLLRQLERDSGRHIRRRYRFPEERTIETLSAPGEVRQPYPPISTQHYSGSSRGAYTWRRETVKRIWFSGCYSYLYHQGQTLWDKLVRAEQEGNRLYGLRLSPELAWELAPWSWLADWKSNAGDVITNLSAFSRDGLVLRWGYVMCDLRITDTHTVHAQLKAGPRTLVQSFTTHVKKRTRATPYGFGLDPDWKDFSSRQLAILSALGISRVA